jgi:hypothetical protein
LQGVPQTNEITDAEINELSDAEMSGELASRPGINRVRELIDERWPDLLLLIAGYYAGDIRR